MPDLENRDREGAVINQIDNPVVPLSNSVFLLR
jgi:hypothetical protein